jgi:hypothetical protein
MVLPPHQRQLLKLNAKSNLAPVDERIEILEAKAWPA